MLNTWVYLAGTACCTRVTKVLCKIFHSLLEAERNVPMLLRASSPQQLHSATNGREFYCLTYFLKICTPFILVETLIDSTKMDQQALASTAFSSLASMHDLSVPCDYVRCSIKAMKCLKESGRLNVLYSLAKGLATPHSDGTGSKFPTTRMPMGLLEYMVGFFELENIQKVCDVRNYNAT